MDQFDAFGYFITNLMLHNLVLVALAVLLGLVLGRLAFGASKARLEKLGEALKAAEMRADAADRDLEKLRSQHAGPADGRADGPAVEDVEKLRASIKVLEQRVAEADGVAEAREKRIQEAIQEREQVEKASAVLRKEMRGLRNRMKEIEQQELQVAGLESALHDAEERLARSEATVAKESRFKAGLEKKVEDLECQLSELRGGPESGSDGGGISPAPVPAGDSSEADGEELLQIKGVGAVLVQRLRDRGVTTLRQIADWSDEDLTEISSSLGLGKRPERGDWRGQARALCGDESADLQI